MLCAEWDHTFPPATHTFHTRKGRARLRSLHAQRSTWTLLLIYRSRKYGSRSRTVCPGIRTTNLYNTAWVNTQPQELASVTKLGRHSYSFNLFLLTCPWPIWPFVDLTKDYLQLTQDAAREIWVVQKCISGCVCTSSFFKHNLKLNYMVCFVLL